MMITAFAIITALAEVAGAAISDGCSIENSCESTDSKLRLNKKQDRLCNYFNQADCKLR
jgi:hypothetical protein